MSRVHPFLCSVYCILLEGIVQDIDSAKLWVVFGTSVLTPDSVRKCVGVNVNERTQVHNVRRRGFNRTEAEIVVVQAVVNTR